MGCLSLTQVGGCREAEKRRWRWALVGASAPPPRAWGLGEGAPDGCSLCLVSSSVRLLKGSSLRLLCTQGTGELTDCGGGTYSTTHNNRGWGWGWGPERWGGLP